MGLGILYGCLSAMISYSSLVFLVVVSSAIGYVIGNIQRYGFWNLSFSAIFLTLFLFSFGHDTSRFTVMIVSACGGFLLPRSSGLLRFFGGITALSLSIRWAARRKEKHQREETPRSHRHNTHTNKDSSWSAQQERARDGRRRESRAYRKKSDKSGSEQRQKGKKKGNHQNDSATALEDQIRNKHLETLGLYPENNYTKDEIRLAYRRKASQYHPDKQNNTNTESINCSTKNFIDVICAAEYFGVKFKPK